MLVSIIIPTYNEKQNIILLLKEILNLKINKEIIVVDDNSSDRTAEEIKKRIKNQSVKVYVRKKQKGLATAILYGIKKTKGDIIVGMDADFNHPPKLIRQLVKNLERFDLVIASRFIEGGGMEDSWRYFFTFLFNLFLKYILSFPTMDNLSGFYAIKKDKLITLPLKKTYQGYGEYHLRLIWLAKQKKYKIKEIPVYYQKRLYGKSKSNLFILFFRYIIEAFKLKFLRYEL